MPMLNEVQSRKRDEVHLPIFSEEGDRDSEGNPDGRNGSLSLL